MTKSMWMLWGLAGLMLTLWPTGVHARALDKDGDMKLGVRMYVNTRIGTEATDRTATYETVNPATGRPGSGEQLEASETFPFSGAGHLRQNRFFIEAEFDHDISRLMKEGLGPLELLNRLPFKIKGLKYHLVFRGEGDGLYDWGPREYSTAGQWTTGPAGDCPVNKPQDGTPCVPLVNLPNNPVGNKEVDAPGARRHLRRLGTDRERLFQAYVEGSVGRLFVRLGRQIWVWGETDGFALLDQINPVDSSFGGFLISLDERRVPLDMLRMEYRIGEIGKISEIALQAYGAIDNKVGFAPGIPAGSPWALPNNDKPSATTFNVLITPRRTLSDMRGGARLVWNMLDATCSLAHYYTYFDTEALQVYVPALDLPQLQFPAGLFPDGFSVHAIHTAPRVQVTGATTTFPIPERYARFTGLGGELILRSEFAYFKDEPRFVQSQLDPFIFNLQPGTPIVRDPLSGKLARTAGRVVGDSINYVVGLDVNQYIRFLNPYQTFFFSTQFFYKHLLDAVPRGKVYKDAPRVVEGEVLPIPQKNVQNPTLDRNLNSKFGALEPSFLRHPTDQFLHTLFVSTSYRSGMVNPGFLIFYDWTGSLVFAPSVTFQRDPWRFTVEYDILDAGTLKGASGTSLLRDRDNVLFQFEYAI